MKKCNYIIVFFVIVMAFIASCNRTLYPVNVGGKSGKNYDEAAFNYVYVEGVKQKLMGNNGDALKYMEQCIKLNPESDASYYQMAQILLASGDLGNGKKYANKALSIDEQNFWYIMLLAGLHYQERDLDSAIIFYEKAVRYYPDKESLQLTLGNLYSENNNYDKAKDIFDSFDKKYGVNEASTLSSIKGLIAAERYNEALIKIQELVKQYPDEILYSRLLASTYQSMGQNDKSADVFKQLIERDPLNGQVQYSLCDFLLAEKNYDELFLRLNGVILNAEVSFEDKIELFARIISEPELIKETNNRVILSLIVLEASYADQEIVTLLRPEYLTNQGRSREAAVLLEEIVRKSPDNYYAWEKLLLTYLQLRDYKQLFVRAEECASKFNMSFLAKILYANAALELEKYPVAIEELRKAEILAGDNVEYVMQVYTMRADVYYRNKDYNKAFEIYEQALQRNSEDLTVLNNFAYYLAEQDLRLKEAEEMAKLVIDKEKDNTTYLDTYAWVLYKRGKFNEAAKIMSDIVNSGEEPDAEWYEHYGYILKGQKKCSKAIEIWNMALKLDNTKSNLLIEIQNCKK